MSALFIRQGGLRVVVEVELMRRGDDVGDVLTGEVAAQCDGFLERGRAVVDAEKDVAVNVDVAVNTVAVCTAVVCTEDICRARDGRFNGVDNAAHVDRLGNFRRVRPMRECGHFAPPAGAVVVDMGRDRPSLGVMSERS